MFCNDSARRAKTVLLTGFEPFSGETTNPSREIARWLDGSEIAGHQIVGSILPSVFRVCTVALKKLIRDIDPDLVVCLGQAGGRAGITPERVAINVDDARIPDNAGQQPVDQPIVPHGPTAYWSKLPIKAIVATLYQRGVPASVSQTAGTFVCNHLFYVLMHELAISVPSAPSRARKGGFIHVPFLPEQAERQRARTGGRRPPSLRFETMLQAVEIAVRVSLSTCRDIRIAGGATH
jgi:pyroglutamyl-peptidase